MKRGTNMQRLTAIVTVLVGLPILTTCTSDVLAVPTIDELQEQFLNDEARSRDKREEACVDKSGYCSSYKNYCKDSGYIDYLKENCQVTCDYCPQECKDSLSYCDSYADYCKDSIYEASLRKHCAKTCNFCTNPTTIPPPTTQPRTEVPIDQGKVECGKRAPGTRIVGGTMAKPGAWPWQVTMDYLPHKAPHWCGGSIVTPYWIVTASHCFAYSDKPEDYSIVAGQHTLSVSDVYEQNKTIDKIIKHPSYSPSNNHDYDVALIKLKTPVTYNRRVRPVCLPKFDFPDGSDCHISGWGHTRESGDIPMTLMQAKVPLISRESCSKSYQDLGYTISSRMRCAGYASGGIDACQGDSGGPLVCQKDKKFYLMGAISWGVGCARKGRYGVYADLMDLKYWVQETINNN